MHSLRIVSLLPSATEIICALGAGDQLVGVSHECDFPESVRGLPVLSHARVSSKGPSGMIDASIRTLVRETLSIYSLDDLELEKADPDVIVTQDLCEVCAVSLDDVQRAVAHLAHRENVCVVSLRPTRLADVLADIERVASAIGRSAEGREVRAGLERRLAAIAERSKAGRTRPRVASIEWLDPLMLGGTWMPELIELAGGRAAGISEGQLAQIIQSEALVDLHPDVVLIKPCGFSLERALAERELIHRTITGVLPSARIYVSDGNAFFNRPGPRLVESLEILAACVHPDLFEDFAQEHSEYIVRLSSGEP